MNIQIVASPVRPNFHSAQVFWLWQNYRTLMSTPTLPISSLSCMSVTLPRIFISPLVAARWSLQIICHQSSQLWGGRSMLSAAVQVLAFALALLGVLGSTVATLMPNWKVSISVWSSMVAPILQMQGLWMDCVWYSSGIFSCSMKTSLLSLPASLQIMRAAMVLCCMLAVFGLFLASLGLKCTRWGGNYRAKGHTAVAAGGCFILASLLCLVPASWFTNDLITTFLNTALPDSSKYQPGGALCLTFISAGFLLAAGVVFCLSCPGRRSGRPLTEFQPAESFQQQKAVSSSRQPKAELKGNYSLQEYV